MVDKQLSLLIIDLGDSCVVKVEDAYGDPLPHIESSKMAGWGKILLIHMPFNELRTAIDGEKPVPRIERDGDNYRLYDCHDRFGHVLCENAFQVYQQTVGRLLPIYEGGTWTELTGTFESKMQEVIPLRGLDAAVALHKLAEPLRGVIEDITREFNQFLTGLPLKIWTYER